jgi:hypothetical protein
MKSILYLFVSLLLLTSCNNEEFEIVEEVPVEIIPTKPCPTLYSRIMELFPQNTDCTKNSPVLFRDTIQTKITITRETEVFITFISEGAYYQNSFGWYEYDQSTPPLNSTSLNKRILFPNVSQPQLSTGDKMQLGTQKFAPGTVIGFFLIIEGWDGPTGTVNYNKQTHFTDPSLNGGGYQQHTLFKEKQCGDIVLTFEDIPLYDNTNPLYDNDFEDIIFTVSDNDGGNETVSFDTEHLIVL